MDKLHTYAIHHHAPFTCSTPAYSPNVFVINAFSAADALLAWDLFIQAQGFRWSVHERNPFLPYSIEPFQDNQFPPLTYPPPYDPRPFPLRKSA